MVADDHGGRAPLTDAERVELALQLPAGARLTTAWRDHRFYGSTVRCWGQFTSGAVRTHEVPDRITMGGAVYDIWSVHSCGRRGFGGFRFNMSPAMRSHNE